MHNKRSCVLRICFSFFTFYFFKFQIFVFFFVTGWECTVRTQMYYETNRLWAYIMIFFVNNFNNKLNCVEMILVRLWCKYCTVHWEYVPLQLKQFIKQFIIHNITHKSNLMWFDPWKMENKTKRLLKWAEQGLWRALLEPLEKKWIHPNNKN